MLLKRVTIKNFRCFQELQMEMDQSTVLIGENNSGKSSFIDAIRLCLAQTGGRRPVTLDDYDYHLATADAKPEQAAPVEISLDFMLDEHEPDELTQAVNDFSVFDQGNRKHVILRLNSSFATEEQQPTTTRSFVNEAGDPLMGKATSPYAMPQFLKLVPILRLSALRDADREFQRGGVFWTPFTRNLKIPEEQRQRLETELSAINESVLSAHAPLLEVKEHLDNLQSILGTTTHDSVSIEALPTQLGELLTKTQVSLTSATGARLPLARQGSGTQSLAVILLFRAYVAAILSQQFDPLSKPIIAIEEPEAHLHPSATRALWSGIEAIKGQRLVATHSGDLLACVPLAAIRRFRRHNGTVEVRSVGASVLSPEDRRRIEFHLQSCRGELLFARCWLLGEGESEFWALREAADILGHDLDRLGVRVVNTQQSGVEPLVKVANELGIGWHLLADGDPPGVSNCKTCREHLQGRDESKHITALPHANLETLLCEAGFGHVFESHVSKQKAQLIKATKGDPQYWVQVVEAQPNKYKPVRIREVMEEIRTKGAASVPEPLRSAIELAVAIAKENST